ncbi:MAG: outer membrane protein assembly factor BamE [Methylacidiphilales bacterium]|nr:outer membrane protein assembly factor BamE [Candidatus Methylacidiphilales bacterium]
MNNLFYGMFLIFIVACSPAYVIPIQQGNVIYEPDVTKIKVGMSKLEVISVLGEPAITHFFNKNNWTYIYHSKTGGQSQLIDLQQSSNNENSAKSALISSVEIKFDNEIVKNISYTILQ